MKSIRLCSVLIPLLAFTTIYSQNDLPPGVSKDWYTRQVSAINDMQYTFSAAGSKNNFIVNNPANHLGFEIRPSGYRVYNISHSANDIKWDANFTIEGFGKNNEVNITTGNAVAGRPLSVTYKAGNLAVDYTNTAKGLKQDFIIHKKTTRDKKLLLSIKIATALTPFVRNGNQLILSGSKNEQDVKLIYDQLSVWDARGTILPASMHFNTRTGLLAITVDDHNAQYPVTIDPLNRVPEWTTSADGILPALLTNLQLQVETTYGYTVAGLGDINGDGFDDVAVSAPTMADLITGTGSLTGVGAVFIYLGAPSGLPSAPSKILQPTTPVDGALFGYSISAGDVTGDGKNDIVIGAPMDSYQTTASSLLGNTSVHVTAGKVYVYRSEDLFTASVPAPFLQIRLQGSAYFSTGILGVALSNINVNALFGLSVAVTKDLNGDGKDDIVVGSPSYMGVNLLAVQSGAAFVYYSNNLATTAPLQLTTPSPALLGIASLPLLNTNGLLFGFSADGAGDYNNDGYADIVIGAPAGANLNSLGGIFTGQFLGGSAYVYYGSSTGIQNTSTVRLQAQASGLLSNAANLFGYKVKGAENAAGIKTGNIIIGAPNAAVLSNVAGGLQLKAGQVHVFKSKTTGVSGAFASDQVFSSPRSSSVLSILSGQTINVSMLFAASLDNMLDVNCDNIGDIIVGEPLSTAVPVIGADVVGGAAYIYLGKADGTYDPTPYWTLNAEISPLLGVNITSLIGYSVAGAGHVKGSGQGVRSLVGAPANALDFGSGLLNLGNTAATITNFAFDNNGLGKAYSFAFGSCNLTLATKLLSFKGTAIDKTIELKWTATAEEDLNLYELQKSYDGIHFQAMALVFVKEPENDDYNFPDKKPATGKNYYRLKMIEKDGSFSYSDIVIVQFGKKASFDITVAPNPVLSSIHVQMTGLQKGDYRIELHNTAGQVFRNQLFTVSQDSQTETIPRNNMIKGLYWMNVYDNTNHIVKSLKIILD